MSEREIARHWRWLKQRFLDNAEGAMQTNVKADGKRFDALIAAGLVVLYDCEFGFDYYTFTKAGEKRWRSA